MVREFSTYDRGTFMGQRHSAETTQTADVNSAAASSAMTQASSSLVLAANHVSGWTPQRIASIGLGVVLSFAMYAIGNIAHTTDVVVGCAARVEHVTHGLHLAPHDANAVRAFICKM
jgi:hypothetical protein